MPLLTFSDPLTMVSSVTTIEDKVSFRYICWKEEWEIHTLLLPCFSHDIHSPLSIKSNNNHKEKRKYFKTYLAFHRSYNLLNLSLAEGPSILCTNFCANWQEWGVIPCLKKLVNVSIIWIKVKIHYHYPVHA